MSLAQHQAAKNRKPFPAPGVPPASKRTKTEVVTITGQQFTAGIDSVKRAFETLKRIESAVSHPTVPPPSHLAPDDATANKRSLGQTPAPSVPAQGLGETLFRLKEKTAQLADLSGRMRAQICYAGESVTDGATGSPAPSNGFLKDHAATIDEYVGQVEADLHVIGAYLLS